MPETSGRRERMVEVPYEWLCPSFPGGSDSKGSARDAGDPSSIPGSRRFPWRREWQPTLVFLPGESSGQRSLAGYGSWGSQRVGRTRLTD